MRAAGKMGFVGDDCGSHAPSVVGINLIAAAAALVVVGHLFLLPRRRGE